MILGQLNRDDDRAPFRQIADHLRDAITRGDLGPGDRLPSEADLIGHYDVARMTVRQAVAELRGEGLVVAEHGRGVFVRAGGPPPIEVRLHDTLGAAVRWQGDTGWWVRLGNPDNPPQRMGDPFVRTPGWRPVELGDPGTAESGPRPTCEP